mmetsp:Transcript_2591/g.7734  ORF Transcript_2591/g.7734 Transcript_2591/m.7734 type:complete len:392 (-) Transcript_2591:713-1888(-)
MRVRWSAFTASSLFLRRGARRCFGRGAIMDNIERVVSVSDLHVDDEANMAWVESLPARPREALIVAGDVSDRLERLERTFSALADAYGAVFFTIGNHDVWVRDGEGSSLEKLEAVLALAERCGVRTKPAVVGTARRKCLVAPLLSWYHASFDTEPPITNWKGIPSARLVMTDFRRCRWPEDLEPRVNDDEALAKALDDRNDDLDEFEYDDLITFSHFLPRIELIPEKRYLFLPTLTQAVGSRFLGDRVRRLKPDLHVFGHTHINWDATLDGTRYVQAALAYSNEWKSRPSSLAVGALREGPSPRSSPLLVWDAETGGLPRDKYSTRWSDHYDRFPRVPSLTHVLPPYAARLYRAQPGAEVKNVDAHVPPFDDDDDEDHSCAHPRSVAALSL